MPAEGSKVRALAFYLPQFHPIPENDAWWGTGFTEWTNVVKARPLFPGHYQPHLPADLGFYDLRLPQARAAQAELARAYGIDGFCYYHYWFNGKRLLEQPVEGVMRLGEPDFPFCLCWANENWTRRWDGLDSQVLIGQQHTEADDRAHIRWLVEVFADERYIRVEGKPLFLVYRAKKFPDPLRTTTIWREEAMKAGVGELYLCRVANFPDERDDPGQYGFDAAVEFQPDGTNFGEPQRREKRWDYARKLRMTDAAFINNYIYDYSTIIERMLRNDPSPYKRFPCVTPMWDNSARRQQGATILHNSTPEAYERWLKAVIERFEPYSPDENFVFINAWNEWAEGNHLEPCQKWGRAYLEATRNAITNARQSSPMLAAAEQVC